MVTDGMRTRFDDAMSHAEPASAVFALAKALKSEGIGQVTLYRLFAEYQAKTDANDPRYDAIVDAMDLI